SADGKTGMDQYLNVYTRASEADGSLTRVYETDYKEELDPKGRIVHTEGKDEWSLAYSYDYTAGDNTQQTGRITHKTGGDTIELKRTGNIYSADWLDADKKKIGT